MDKITTFDGFDPILVYDRIEEKIIVPRTFSKNLKLSRNDLCDFIFDYISEARSLFQSIEVETQEIELV